MMNISSGGVNPDYNVVELEPSASSAIRSTTQVYLPPATNSPIDNALKIIPMRQSVKVVSTVPTPETDIRNRVLVTPATNNNVVIRTMPSLLVGNNNTNKKVVTVGNNLSFTDPNKSLKYIGTFIKNKKVDSVIASPPAGSPNVVIVTASNSSTSNTPTQYIVSKPGSKGSHNIMLAPIPSNKSKYFAHSNVAPLPGNKMVIQNNGLSPYTIASKPVDRPYFVNKPKPGSTTANVIYYSSSMEKIKEAGRSLLKRDPEVFQPRNKRKSKHLPPHSQSLPYHHIKIKKPDEPTKTRLVTFDEPNKKPLDPDSLKRNSLLATDLNKIVSSSSAVTSFQIVNGQVYNGPTPVQQRRKSSTKDDNETSKEVKRDVPTDSQESKSSVDTTDQLAKKDIEIIQIPDDTAPPKAEELEAKKILDALTEDLKKLIQEEFDPIKTLDWTDQVGELSSSELKFKISDLGLLVLMDQKEEKQRNKVSLKGKQNTILCCQFCETYGMGCEFVNSKFCSKECIKAHQKEKEAIAKKMLERQNKKIKIKEEKAKLLQQRANLDKLGFQEAKILVDEKLKMLRMEKEIWKINGESDCESSQGSSQNSDFKKGSSIAKYINSLKSKSAPVSLFREPFPSEKNPFKIGMKLEGIDPVHPSLFCVLTVSDVKGYRLKLHFDGYSEIHSFWVNANSNEIFHAGWCERTNHNLTAPKGYGEAPFNWGTYLRITKAIAAPKHCFVNNQEKSVIPCGFRIGMKLEAVDKKNSALICVASIADVLDNRILIHFDSWDDIYDYWADASSPYIHPIGWCKENGHQLMPPNHYPSAISFSWERYLFETKCQAAPSRAFKTRTPPDFRRGMKVECVDKRNPLLIRVATVVDTAPHRFKVKIDGWPDQYGYWVDDDNPDIHPIGWCQKTGHPLEPPPSEQDIRNPRICPTAGCRGVGHAKRTQHFHKLAIHCPYSQTNYLREDLVPDRFPTLDEYYEVKESALSKGTKIRHSKTGGNRNLEIEEKEIKVEMRGKKRKLYNYEKSSSPKQKLPKKEDDTEKSKEPWHKNDKLLRETVSAIGENIMQWTAEDVCTFVQKYYNLEEKNVLLFSEQCLDGATFLMLTQTELITTFGYKLGPAIRFSNIIKSLRKKVLDSTNGV